MIRGARSVCEFRDNVIMTTKRGILLLTYISVFDSEKVFKTTYRKWRRFLKASTNILDMLLIAYSVRNCSSLDCNINVLVT